MRIVVTGGSGFVGRALVERLAAEHEVIGIDTEPMPAGRGGVLGDLGESATLEKALKGGCDAVIHLATLPGGAAEADPALARRINLDVTFELADRARIAGCGRFLFASSIAVFGYPLPVRVDDHTPLSPRLIYGAHKAMAETWLAMLSRRGSLDALSLRLPGIVARPGGSASMKSAFMSNLFHAFLGGERIILPVSANATMWLMSRPCLIDNLVAALNLDSAGLPDDRAVSLPALCVSMAALVAELAGQCNADPTLADFTPDAALEAAFGTQPPLDTPRAEALGFTHDGSLSRLVASVLADLSMERDR